ncbi:MAG: GAK system ATP-grasp enzyme [Desulfovibrionaceae bacterium]|nr:GAK system ATP-grasp enzyme [Desulfovibrionaceae bacterium]MBF0513755.1 GAK system ATP-grasp enzyme [Desulfovibrionaceae bacterium]
MKIGVIGIPGGWSSESLADAVAVRTGVRLLIDIKAVKFDLQTGRAMFEGCDLCELDALMIKKIGTSYSPDMLDRLESLRFVAERGVRIFSSPLAILRVLNRLACTVTLRLGGIPMPPTTVTEDPALALETVREYGLAVFKPLYTSKARGMTLISDEPGAAEVIAAYHAENRVMYIQKAIELGDSDLGLAFLGGEYLTTYARCKTNEAWNTTTASGGKYKPADPPAEIVELARKAAGLFGLDFTTVDVALTKDGPYVFEVSAFGGFRGLFQARGIDAAALVADYVLDKVGR